MSARVLVVDDDPQIRQLLVRVLEMENLESVIASNGLDGWHRLQDARIDLVISDFEMPELNGLELARRVRERYRRSVKFVLFSSFEGVQGGITDEVDVDVFLPKPVAVAELIRVIRTLLGLPPTCGKCGRDE